MQKSMSVTRMNKHVELPLAEPVYSTYHFEGNGSAIAVNHPTAKNWYLNRAVNLQCTRKFLNGFTTPEIEIINSRWTDNPHIEKCWTHTRFTGGYIHCVIRNMLDRGYYVVFDGIDDYYVKGKSWYKKRHFNHDGLICGYDQTDKTYCIYAYDSDWVYRKFWTPQKGFESGRIAVLKQGVYTGICAVVMCKDAIAFSPETVYSELSEYLDSDLEKYPFSGEGEARGMVVQAYIAEYVMRLYRGEIPYERMDWRIFRLLWEHKKVMLERILLLEQTLRLNSECSERYKPIVDGFNTMRMLYAAHHMKRRDSVLPHIAEELQKRMDEERAVLTCLMKKMKKELKNEIVGTTEK